MIASPSSLSSRTLSLRGYTLFVVFLKHDSNILLRHFYVNTILPFCKRNSHLGGDSFPSIGIIEHSQLLKLIRNRISRVFENSHQWDGKLNVVWHQKCVGSAYFTCPACSADSMNVSLDRLWALKVNYCFDIFNINTSSSHFSGH